MLQNYFYIPLSNHINISHLDRKSGSMTNNRKTNKRTNEATLKLKRQIYTVANKHFLQAIRPFQLAPYGKLSALAKNRKLQNLVYNAIDTYYWSHFSYEPQKQSRGPNELHLCTNKLHVIFFLNCTSRFNFITPCEAIKINVLCGNVEDFNDFQIQHNSFHNHPSKSNEV